MDLIKRLAVLSLILILPAIAYSQDTAKIKVSLTKRANPDEPGLTAKQAIDQLGKDVYVRDTIFNYKIVSKGYRIFYVGNRDTSKSLHIIIKNSEIQIEPPRWLMSFGSFSGEIILYEGQPSIIITDYRQLATRIQL
ncbi:MAG TPA: hypothetical protein VG367_18635 [Mucilaginibacter sp.]|jgi:hypothetical protein|nr:hypothetical protein [Mucilaginibacter sp.]